MNLIKFELLKLKITTRVGIGNVIKTNTVGTRFFNLIRNLLHCKAKIKKKKLNERIWGI